MVGLTVLQTTIHEKIQMKLYDKFFSWGWSDKSKKTEKLFCQKTIAIKIKQNKKHPG